jgi:hypothetical protein
VVQPGSSDQIAEALTALVTDEGLRSRLGTAARRRALDFGLSQWHQSLALLWSDLVRRDRVKV